jgi:hypothetical protein
MDSRIFERQASVGKELKKKNFQQVQLRFEEGLR